MESYYIQLKIYLDLHIKRIENFSHIDAKELYGE